MKNCAVVIMFFSAICFGAADKKADKKAEERGGLRYSHVYGKDGEILATIDSETGEIDYKKKCEDVTPVLISRIAAVVTACNNELAKAKPIPKVKKKK